MNLIDIKAALAVNHELSMQAIDADDYKALHILRMERQTLQDEQMRLSIVIGSERRALKAWGLKARNRNKAQSQNEKAFLRSLCTPTGMIERALYSMARIEMPRPLRAGKSLSLHAQVCGRVERIAEEQVHKAARLMPPMFLGFNSKEERDRQWAGEGAKLIAERFALSPDVTDAIEAFGLRMAGIEK